MFSSGLRRNLYFLNATAPFLNPHIDLDVGTIVTVLGHLGLDTGRDGIII